MNRKLIYVLIGIPVLVGGYFIIKMVRGKKRYSEDLVTNPPKDLVADNTEDEVSQQPVNTTVAQQKFEDYIVDTLVSPLNVRVTPNSAEIVTKLAKGSTIKARPSSIEGWYEVSQNGITTLGYSSAAYLKKA